MANYDAEKLASYFQVHVRGLERHFRRDMGRSPQDWLNEQRMIAARWLLLEAKSVKRVAMELGFKQLSHFCRQFKACYGISPSEFVRIRANLNAKCRY